MDDQIMNMPQINASDSNTIPYIYNEIDIYNHPLMAKWIKEELQELDDVLTKGIGSTNFD